MDFRAVDPGALQWTLGPRGLPAARVATTGAKVIVQTPTCPVRVTLSAPGMYRMELRLVPGVAAHAAFAKWACDVEESAAEASALDAWKGAKRRSSWVFNDTARLMAFSDTMAFDADGKLSADLMDARGCAALIELQGLWATDAKWGVRWKVSQVKFSKEPPSLPVSLENHHGDGEADDEAAVPPDASMFAFLNDE